MDCGLNSKYSSVVGEAFGDRSVDWKAPGSISTVRCWTANDRQMFSQHLGASFIKLQDLLATFWERINVLRQSSEDPLTPIPPPAILVSLRQYPIMAESICQTDRIG